MPSHLISVNCTVDLAALINTTHKHRWKLTPPLALSLQSCVNQPYRTKTPSTTGLNLNDILLSFFTFIHIYIYISFGTVEYILVYCSCKIPTRRSNQVKLSKGGTNPTHGRGKEAPRSSGHISVTPYYDHHHRFRVYHRRVQNITPHQF